MAADLHGKLDKVIRNQHDLLTRMEILESANEEMEKSLVFTTRSVEDVEKKNKSLSEGLCKMASQMKEAQSKIVQLEEANLHLERYSRGFNLRFGGIPETLNENPSYPYEKVREILTTKFNMADIKIENAHRSGRVPKVASEMSLKPRHILVKFLYRPERLQILKHAKSSLINTSMFVLQDLPAADLAKKRSLRDIMKKAYDSGLKVVFRNGDLFIDGKKHTKSAKSSST